MWKGFNNSTAALVIFKAKSSNLRLKRAVCSRKKTLEDAKLVLWKSLLMWQQSHGAAPPKTHMTATEQTLV